MNITLFGYPRTGKTTLFNLISGARLEVGDHGEGRRDPNVRTVPIPDPRLDRLSALHPGKKKVAASLDLTDLVGISYGEVKSSLLLGHLRKADGLVHVVRAFRDPQIPHPKGRVDPAQDIRFMEDELVLADLVLADGRLERLEKDLRKMKDPEGEKEREVLSKIRPCLESGRGVRGLDLTPTEEKLIRSLALLSLKPLLHMVNLDEGDLPRFMAPEAFGPPGSGAVMAFCGKIEAEIGELEEPEKAVFMAEYGLRELCAAGFFGRVTAFLDRITFYTVGKDEVRAWTVRKESPAVRAAGAIHTDIEKGFIRAEVIAFDEFLRRGSLQHAKEAGAIRLEGRDYVVQDGDIVYFRFAP